MADAAGTLLQALAVPGQCHRDAGHHAGDVAALLAITGWAGQQRAALDQTGDDRRP